MDELETGSLPCFTAVPLDGALCRTPVYGTFVASNVGDARSRRLAGGDRGPPSDEIPSYET
jgi:hypothetical protein